MPQYSVRSNDFFTVTYTDANGVSHLGPTISANAQLRLIECVNELLAAGTTVEKISYRTTVMITGTPRPIDPLAEFGAQELTVDELVAIGAGLEGWVARQR